MVIVVDFDGTVVKHEFPKVGEDIGAVPVLNELIKNGHKLVLFTMRSDGVEKNGAGDLELKPYLTDAVAWFKKHNIPLFGIQVNPEQHTWTTSPKAYGSLILDDASLQAPLKQDTCPEYTVCHGAGNCIVCGGSGIVGRPYYDWEKARELLVSMGLIK